MTVQPEFRNLLFAHDAPRLTSARGLTAREFGEAVKQVEFPAAILAGYAARQREPFRGITCDGHVEPGLFALGDEGAPAAAMFAAARDLLDRLSPAEAARLRYPLDAPEWRRWSNPEFLANDNGLRMEDCTPEVRAGILRLIAASLSTKGFEKARGCMKTNAFLGQICDVPLIMNEWSYNILLFGEPSDAGPWGWSLYGHHLALNCLVMGGQMVISPTFLGAEPNVIDTGPDKGLRLFDVEEGGGLALMRSLSPALRDRATTYALLEDPAMPAGRWDPADERSLGGAFHDNRIIPYEGVPISDFDARQKRQLMDIVEAFVITLPDGPRAAKLAQVEAHLDRTWWSWIGGHGDDDPFYYRIQSPVLMTEFDHHTGKWLTNTVPAKCHIHTIVRTPNGNDYGHDLLRQHFAEVHPARDKA